MSVLAAEQIVKVYGGRVVLAGVDLRVDAGEVLVILGPNGAGKSTLLKILALLARPTTGRICIAGQPASEDSAAARGLIGAVLHVPLLYDGLTAAENLQFYGRLYGVPRLRSRVCEVLEEVGLGLYARELVRTFSNGMRQRLALARAMLHRPRLLLLDEPFSGLDVSASELLAAQLERFKTGGGAVLLVTHQWEHLSRIADRAVILSAGRVAAELPVRGVEPARLRRRYQEAVGQA